MNAYGQNILQLLPADSLQFFNQAHKISAVAFSSERKGFLVFLTFTSGKAGLANFFPSPNPAYFQGING